MLLLKLILILFNSVPFLMRVKKVAQVTGSAGERGILGNPTTKRNEFFWEVFPN